ncbi:MAG: class I SAM-dependent methyltransferase [Myxococcota bacterium]|jgi:SAM-dependent methyltransferase|nr:class I SAM-dependent methyltransferase [Myxococcota bacterium]
MREHSTRYSDEFYDGQRDGSRRSAELAVPWLLSFLPAKSVVDVGCGVGTWLSVFQKQGVSDVLGLDGSYVDRERLLIPSDRFMPADLRAPPSPGRSFDLALSLEVAEHLPHESSRPFVEFITSLAPIVVFSAATPGQSGTGHINEQWPDYWAERFEERGYRVIDCIRPQLWSEPAVEWWYAQNTLLYASEAAIASNEQLARFAERTDRNRLSMVHPRGFAAAQSKAGWGYVRYLMRRAGTLPSRLGRIARPS